MQKSLLFFTDMKCEGESRCEIYLYLLTDLGLLICNVWRKIFETAEQN